MRGLRCRCQNENEIDEVEFFSKEQKSVCTKQTLHTYMYTVFIQYFILILNYMPNMMIYYARVHLFCTVQNFGKQVSAGFYKYYTSHPQNL